VDVLSPDELRDATCVACPGQHLPLGAFDVAPHPSPAVPYSPAAGFRVSASTGTPTCVHPFRVGVPPARYRSAGDPLPTADLPAPEPADEDLALPADATLLEAWLIALIRRTPADRLAAVLGRAESDAAIRFPAADIVTALRRALTTLP
jgi:hypothetical protein